jgi:hypothetical protein
VQDVRDAALGQRRALLDAEPVLLVDDRDREVGEPDLLLDQRVGADRDLRLSAGDPRSRGRVLLRGQGAREQHERDVELGADPLDRQEVLLGERLGRRHQRALPAGLDRTQQRVERHDRLPGADVALEQPRHGRRAGEVGVDLRDRPLLVLRQLERQRRPVAGDELARRRQRRGDAGLPLGRSSRQGQLEDEQLVERESPPTLLRLVERARSVEGDERVAAERQPLPLLQRRGERVRAVGGERQRRLEEVAELPRRELLAGGVDGRVVRGRGAAVQVVGPDREPVAVR